MILARWTGAAGVDVTHGGRTYLLDPYHSRVGKLELLATRPCPRPRAIERYLERLPGAPAAVVVGHTHFDHALDVPEIARRVEGPVIGSQSLDRLLEAHGQPGRVRVCRGGERLPLAGGARVTESGTPTVTMLPSAHGRAAFGRVPFPGEIPRDAVPPLETAQYRHGTVFSPLLEVGGVRLLHVSSACFDEAAFEGVRCDAVFLCVPGWRHASGYPGALLRAVRPRVVVPFHFDDFTAPWRFDHTAASLPLLGMRAFLREVRAAVPEATIMVPRPFEALYL